MVVDPVELAIFTVAGGAVTTKFVSEAWNLGKNWLDEYFLKHQPQAKEKAQENALDFLVELGNRIQKLEKETQDDAIFKEQIKNSLSNPDFSALLQDALISSARTSSNEKHTLLAKVVSDRLLADQESVRSLTTSMVVDAIPKLSPKHLKILGLMSLIMWRIIPNNIPKEIEATSWRDYLVKRITPLFPDEKIFHIDYMHLVSISCIYKSIGSMDIKLLIEPPEETCSDWNSDIFLKETDIGEKINQLWDDEMNHCNLTSTGGLIGTYIHDEITGTKTDLSKIYGTF